MRTEADREGSSCWKRDGCSSLQTLASLIFWTLLRKLEIWVSILKSLLYKIVIDQLSHTLLGPRSGEGQPGYTLARLVSEVELCPVFENQEIGARVSYGEARINHHRVWSPGILPDLLVHSHLTTRWSQSLSLFSTFGFLSCMPLTWWVE